MRPANDDMALIGKGIAQLCDKKRMSYREVCDKAGLAPGTVSNVAGGKSCKLITLFSILKVLDVQLGDFFMDLGFTDEREEYTDTILKITVRSRGFRRAYGEVENEINHATD